MRFTRRWRGREITAALRPAAPRATALAAETLKGYAIPETPLRDGPLRDSFVVIPGTEADPSSTLLVDSVYAAVQHERDDFEHPIAGKAHYVSDPMRQRKRELYQVMAGVMSAALRKAAS